MILLTNASENKQRRLLFLCERGNVKKNMQMKKKRLKKVPLIRIVQHLPYFYAFLDNVKSYR